MKKTLAILCALGACAAAPAFAQPVDATVKTDVMVNATMKMMDTDANGLVSMTEHTNAMKAMFTAADTNADGMLSADEMTVAATAKMTAMQMPLDANKTKMMVQSRLQMLDTNKDGMVSFAEQQTSDDAMFNMADSDADGMVSMPEMSAAMSNHMKK